MSDNPRLPLVDLRAQQAEVNPLLEGDLLRVLAEGSFIGGPEVAAFEREYADFVGANHCVGVGNGTDALELALRGLGVSSGDEVVMPVNTFVATAAAVVRIGARPVFVDVDPKTLLIDPSGVASALTDRTRAVVPVHLYGQVAPVEEIESVLDNTDVAIVEDAAQAQGALRRGRRAGSLGIAAATSFYPGKNLGAAGDAGGVTTSDACLARRVRLLSNQGSAVKYEHEIVGYNSRLDAIQAVVLRHKLRRLADWNDRRRRVARTYDILLADLPDVVLPVVDPDGVPVWHLYVIRVPARDIVLKLLNEQGVDAGIHYPRPIHLTPAFESYGYAPGDFPIAEQAAGQILSLPIHPHLTDDQQVRVVDSLRVALRRGV